MCTENGSAIPTDTIENDRVKVIEWRLKKVGDNTGWHRHAFDYVVVPLFDGVQEIVCGCYQFRKVISGHFLGLFYRNRSCVRLRQVRH